MYAMKVLRKDKIKMDNKVEYIMTERRILERINHPFLIKMHWAFASVRLSIHQCRNTICIWFWIFVLEENYSSF